MNEQNAKEFVFKWGRPLERAVCRYFFEGGSREAALAELKKYRNPDGGFGHGLEADYLNPNSTPIAVCDAVKLLIRLDAMEEDAELMNGILKYLISGDCFDAEKQQWQFAAESNRLYPHAIWWEKNGDGLAADFNPAVALAAVVVCYGTERDFGAKIIRRAFEWLRTGKPNGDGVQCYLLCWELLNLKGITDVIPMDSSLKLLQEKIMQTVCPDVSKYGIEYAPVPSDFIRTADSPFLSKSLLPLIRAEGENFAGIQMENGGFDITWKWYTDYPEFHTQKICWQARITMEKLLFYRNVYLKLR